MEFLVTTPVIILGAMLAVALGDWIRHRAP